MKFPISRVAADSAAADDSSPCGSFFSPSPAARAFSAALLGLALAMSAPSFGAGPPLALAQAQKLALERSRQLPAKDAAAAASREMAVAAARLPDPTLRLGIENLPVTGADQFSLTADFMTMGRVGLMQEITGSEKRQWRARRFDAEAGMYQAEKTVLATLIRRETALAWLERYYAESLAGVIARQAAEARLEIQAAEGAYRSGRGSQADVFAAHSALTAIEDMGAEMEGRVRNANAGLARWVGEAADAPLGERPAIHALRMDSTAVDAQITHHPEIAVMARKEEIAAADAEVARTERSPDWSIEFAYSQRGPAYSNMVSFGVSIPLQWDRPRRQDRELASRLALLQQAQDERREAVRAHTGEIRAMLVDWESRRARLERYEREIIPLAAERTKAALAAYRGAKAGVSDLLLARRGEIEARMQAVQLEREIARTWAQLTFLRPDEDTAKNEGATSGKEVAR